MFFKLLKINCSKIFAQLLKEYSTHWLSTNDLDQCFLNCDPNFGRVNKFWDRETKRK